MLLALTLLVATNAYSFECNVCHSKNPAMVKMHTALRGQGCFGCHKVGEKLMGKGQPKDKQSLLQRRQVEVLCLPCHTPETKESTQGSSTEKATR